MPYEVLKTVWTPDLIGPIYKKEITNLREVLNTHRHDTCTRTMATFVPDELIYESDLTKKSFRKFKAVIMVIDMTQLFSFYKRFTYAQNGGSYGFFSLLNDYMSAIVEEVYINHGDVLKFSHNDLLIMWKISRNEFIARIIRHVIMTAESIQKTIAALKNEVTPIPKLSIIISMGTAVFSVIGDDRSRSFVICGGSIQDIKYTRRVCLPGDIVLCESAWQYCVPSHYEYVLKDADNVKIIKVLEAPEEILMARDMGIEEDIIELAKSPSHVSILSDVSVEQEIRATHFRTRVSVVDALRRRIGMYLRSYMVTAVLMQIDNEQSLAYLIEIRNVTVVCISIIPFDCTVFELISLTDEIYKTIQNIIESYSGLMCLVNLFEKDISFIIIFGLRSLNSENNNILNGVLSACQILKEVKHIIGIKAILIGVSCGLAFCGIIGHIVRRQFMVFGHCVDMAISLMMISYDKIYCDYNIVLKSTLKRERFRRHGIKTLRKIGKCQIYEILDEPLKTEVLSSLEYKYPLLGRLNEIEYFKDLLDEIGISERRYSGLVIEGIERSGKSRILDAYVTIVKSREIKLVQLPLHPSFAEKSYSVIYHILLQWNLKIYVT
ncbi:adenylate cyclase type 10-like [Apis cerana]|uniref:adenylate cyclase type 10-like n=1 Tax=Apis cerana TaxID=7461 RepID=UPI002B22FE52|nr:adenylate cyclase type 10-like [Apis cerana]